MSLVASVAIKAQMDLSYSSLMMQKLFFYLFIFLISSQNKLQTNKGPVLLLTGSDLFGVISLWIK